MQYKWKLNCWVLMLSSCFVQTAIADKGKTQFSCSSVKYNINNKILYDKESLKVEKCISAKTLAHSLIETHSKLHLQKLANLATSESPIISPNTEQKIDDSNVKRSVQGRNIAMFKDPELIFVKDGAILKNFVLDNNAQAYVSNDGAIDDPGRSINNIIMNGAVIYVDAGGLSENSKIENGGAEIVRASKGQQGFSQNAVIKYGGKQIVSNGGKAEGAEIYGGEQFVFGGVDAEGLVKDSTVSNTIIYGQGESLGKQKVYDGGIVWNTKVMRGGVQDITKEEQSAKSGGSAFNTEIFDNGEQHVWAGGKAVGVTLNDTSIQEVYAGGYVKNLTIHDNATSVVYAGATLEGAALVNNFGQIHLYAGNDQHRTTVEEIILNGKDTKLYSITAKSDGKSSFIQKLSGEGSVVFSFTGSDPYYSQLHVNNLSGSLHFEFNTDLAHGRGDYLFIENGEGSHTVSVADSGVEITDSNLKNRDLITDYSGGAHFTLKDLSGKKIDAIDGGAYMYSLKQRTDENEKIWFLSANRVGAPEFVIPDVENPFAPGGLVTTPSTDAVLDTVVAPDLIFNNELQTIRMGRGILDKNKKNTAIWTYVIESRERVATDHTNFKLEQTGIIFGADQLNELTHGELYIGGFGSYDQARVIHARGGASNVDTYSIGASATYLDTHGWYLDAILKYNYYQDNLRAFSTNGLVVQGDYNQWAIGGAFEMGCYFETAQNSWMQPYIKVTGVQIEDKKIKLSNGMTADISTLTSLRSEIGLFAGHEFIVGEGTPLTTYITAAWLRENINDNYTTINEQHKFITDLSGNVGRLGIGLNSFVSDKLKLYTEAYYSKGRKIKQLFQGILGIRYSF